MDGWLARVGGLAIAAALLHGCGGGGLGATPAGADAGAGDAVPADGPAPIPYRFEVVASASCPTSGFAALPDRDIVFDMGLVQAGGAWVLHLPLPEETLQNGYVVPNAGPLVVTFTAAAGGVTGTASGYGIAADAVHSCGLAAPGSQAGDAQLTGQGTFAGGPLAGTLSGNVSAGTYRLNDAGECTAPDHAWTLTPE
jgi:hypothetical protein